MITSEIIKRKAIEYGADIVGIGDIDYYKRTAPEHDPKMICPSAKCVIGLGIGIPEGMIKVLENGKQQYALTSLYTKTASDELFIMLLLRMARLIENEGYEACLQRSSPNIKAHDDFGTNPEVSECTRLGNAVPVEAGKPAPEVLIDFAQSAVICGIGSISYKGGILTPEYGPFQRLAFIITNAPLETDPIFRENICESCGECVAACPGNAILEDQKIVEFAGNKYKCGTYDTWQCSVYYRGAHKSNPYITDDFLKGNPKREAILNGEKRFDEESAKKIYPELDFLPRTQYGYVPCLCKRKCEIACYNHLKQKGAIKKGDGFLEKR